MSDDRGSRQDARGYKGDEEGFLNESSRVYLIVWEGVIGPHVKFRVQKFKFKN
uniref:Uncharacterized protein n=1 Tax=Oryza sativa subsp. japonica TaxID=39947 RepID=Q75GB7_ORYSJ|nr:hypothetical protein [Oryza sativa Japonica Group]